MAEKASPSEGGGGGGGGGENEKANSISICGMQFAYPGQHPLFYEFNLNISPGSRCLLVGANGSGKSKFDLFYANFEEFVDLAYYFLWCREDNFAENNGREAYGRRKRCGASDKWFGFS
jgi:ABC-type phosphate/phosphonate transport system ATPase subunit